MVVIGLTGGLGTGKSTVARMFQQLGAVVLDADALAHEAMEPRRLAWRQVVRAFGEAVLNPDQTINRGRLAQRVFRDGQARRRLERILHPQVLREIRLRLGRLRCPSTSLRTPSRARVEGRRARAVVLDVPLLIEAGAQRLVDALVVVTAPPEVQRRRITNRRGWSEEETEARIAAQWDLAAKAALADYVVDNSDGVDVTRTQVKRIWKRLVPHRSSKPSSTSLR